MGTGAARGHPVYSGGGVVRDAQQVGGFTCQPRCPGSLVGARINTGGRRRCSGGDEASREQQHRLLSYLL